MSNISYTITDNTISVFINGRTYIVNRTDERYTEVREALRNKNFDAIPDILDVKLKLISESNGGLYLYNGMLRCDKYDVNPVLASRIVALFREGFDITPLSLFLENLMSNPSETARSELYKFIEACDLPITADGHFLAYKMVRHDFKDLYTGTMDNSIGARPTMDRDKVDPVRENHCSTGLHFCSQGYLGHYGTRSSSQVVVVKINPRDVVSIPSDYNNAKGRACTYEIVDAIGWDELIKPLVTDQYSDVPETDDDEADVPVSGYAADASLRWEVRNSNDGTLADAYTSRKDARNARFDGQFIHDAVNKVVVAGRDDSDGSWRFGPVPSSVPSGAKLDESTVAEIRRRLADASYDSITDLANEYGVSDRTVRRIRDWESWTHVIDY